MNFYKITTELRKISRNWSDITVVRNTLLECKMAMRSLVLTKEMFDLYDKIVEQITIIDMTEDEQEFDGRVFSTVMIDFGFDDIIY